MEGERLVDRPDPLSGLSLADGCQRLPNGRRVMAVVIVDDHASPFPFSLQASADAVESGKARSHTAGRHAEGERRSSHSQGVRSIVAACQAKPRGEWLGERGSF
jgi:hypothetical protein